MGLTKVSKGSLWTPEGEVMTAEKDVIPLSRDELIMLSKLHEFAQKYQLTIVCKRCDSAMVGRNNDQTVRPGVECQCRQWQFIR